MNDSFMWGFRFMVVEQFTAQESVVDFSARSA
jgi:hypothetical protein